MIPLIALPFLVLIIAICMIGVMRGLRHASDLRHRQLPLTIPSDHRRPSDEFHDQTWLPLCNQVASIACERLHRPLTPRERRIIWRSRTPVVLEAALQELTDATSADAVTALLERLPSGLNRPDPTSWCATMDEH